MTMLGCRPMSSADIVKGMVYTLHSSDDVVLVLMRSSFVSVCQVPTRPKFESCAWFVEMIFPLWRLLAHWKTMNAISEASISLYAADPSNTQQRTEVKHHTGSVCYSRWFAANFLQQLHYWQCYAPSSPSFGLYFMHLKKKNTATRNQSILAVDEPIVDHHRITSIQVTALFVLANFSYICPRHSGKKRTHT